MDFRKILIDVKKQLQVDVLDNFVLEKIATNIAMEVLNEVKIKKIKLDDIKFNKSIGEEFRKKEFKSLEEIHNYLINFCDKAFPTFENINILGDLILST